MRLPVFLVEDGLITDAQVRRLREKRMSGKTLAAAAGMGRSGIWYLLLRQTITGRLIAVILMLVGIRLFATLGASVAAYFIESDTEDRMARIEELLKR